MNISSGVTATSHAVTESPRTSDIVCTLAPVATFRVGVGDRKRPVAVLWGVRFGPSATKAGALGEAPYGAL
jgi:hypothetical protein